MILSLSRSLSYDRKWHDEEEFEPQRSVNRSVDRDGSAAIWKKKLKTQLKASAVINLLLFIYYLLLLVTYWHYFLFSS